ncbi:MAG: hypothetical protein IPK64_03430 [bacterium]|nr:hypothetical protein [bacterium]
MCRVRFAVSACLNICLAIAAAGECPARAPSLAPGMPPEVQSIRECRLEKAQYEELAARWRTFLERNPDSAVAEVQLGRALRYAGAPADEVYPHFASALRLDADCPEALDAAAATWLSEWKPLGDGAAGCYELGLKAVELAPGWADPHFALWPLALALGRTQEADEHVAALVRKGGIPAPVLDYCHNMLAGAARNALIFTNGDNDTYGCRALQAAYGLRLDVQVVNLSLIGQPEIDAEIFGRFGDRSPLSRAERDALRKEFQSDFVRDGELYSTKVLRAVVAKAVRGEWRTPIYLAVTIPGATELCPQPLVLEGVLWRVAAAAAGPGGPGDTTDPATDVKASHRLFEDLYRLESATDLGYDWERNNSVRALMDNYISAQFRLAVAAAKAGEQAMMRAAFRRGLELARFHGRDELAASLRSYWRKLDPANPEIGRLEPVKG